MTPAELAAIQNDAYEGDSSSGVDALNPARQKAAAPQPKKAEPEPEPDTKPQMPDPEPPRSPKGVHHEIILKDAPTYHKGIASVPKTGPAILKKGEAVIPADKNPANPANAKFAKEYSSLGLRKATSGGYVATHDLGEGGKPEEHILTDLDAVHDHLDEHLA